MKLTKGQSAKLKTLLFWSFKYSWGGDFDFAIGAALDYFDRIQQTK